MISAPHLPALASILAVLPAQVLGQTPREAEDAKLRADCRLAAQVLETGQPAPQYAWAMSFVLSCDETGPLALAAHWRSPRLDTTRQKMGQLFYIMSSLRDERLVDTMFEIAADPSPPTIVRLSALRVLVPYFEPGRSMRIEALESPPQDGPIRAPFVILGSQDYVGYHGARPITEATTLRIVEFINDLAEREPDSIVRNAAIYLSAGIDTELELRRRTGNN